MWTVPNRWASTIAGTGTLEGIFLAGWLESSNASRLEVSQWDSLKSFKVHPGLGLASSGSGLSGPWY
jgi:hypothetical protein